MKTKLFFLLLLVLAFVSLAKIPIETSATIIGSLNVKRTPIQPPGTAALPPAARHSRASTVHEASYGQLPLSFEANQGQTDPQVQFLC